MPTTSKDGIGKGMTRMENRFNEFICLMSLRAYALMSRKGHKLINLLNSQSSHSS